MNLARLDHHSAPPRAQGHHAINSIWVGEHLAHPGIGNTMADLKLFLSRFIKPCHNIADVSDAVIADLPALFQS